MKIVDANVLLYSVNVSAEHHEASFHTRCQGSRLVQPGEAHARLVRQLLTHAGAGGNLVNDAHLAAIGLERRCGIVAYDADFARFVDVRWSRPDDLDAQRPG